MEIGDIIQLITIFKYLGGDDIKNVFTWRIEENGGGAVSALLDDLEIFADDFWSTYMPNCAQVLESTALVLNAYDMEASRWDQRLAKAWTTQEGESPDDPLVGTVAPFIVGYTNIPRYRGRKSLMPPAENGITQGLLTPTVIADIGLMGVKYIDLFVGDEYTLTPGTFNLTDEAFHQFFRGFTFNDISGTQVRRKQGVGD